MNKPKRQDGNHSNTSLLFRLLLAFSVVVTISVAIEVTVGWEIIIKTVISNTETSNSTSLTTTPILPTATPIPPTPTPVPTELEMLTIAASSISGEIYNCPSSGEYRVTVTDGAYNPFPDERNGWWRTRLEIFLNRAVEYNDVQEPAGDYAVGNWQQSNITKDEAIALGQNASTSIECGEGKYLRFVTIDHRDSYGGNVDEVTISIEKIR